MRVYYSEEESFFGEKKNCHYQDTSICNFQNTGA